jgi:protein gp37
MAKTKIEWANKVWNPVTGCTYGCEWCYARRMAVRLRENPYTALKYMHGFNPTFHPEECTIEKMKQFKKGDKVFVCSMGDLFDPMISVNDTKTILELMENSEAQFLLLSKRPVEMQDFFQRYGHFDSGKNIWIGASMTNQQDVNVRMTHLLTTPAHRRFISIEPMLGPIDLHNWVKPGGLDWVIVGGQTGQGARPVHPDWVRSIRDQCKEAGVAFFFKGWGEWIPRSYKVGVEINMSHVKTLDKIPFIKVGKNKSGAELDGEVWHEFPEGLSAHFDTDALRHAPAGRLSVTPAQCDGLE